MSCSYAACGSSKHKKEPGITFHKFPVDENRRQAWMQAIARKNWTPPKSAFVCSKHFLETDFVRSIKVTNLKDSAVPLPLPDDKENFVDQRQVEPANADNIKRTALITIENVQLKRKLEQTIMQKEEFQKKIKQQDRIIQQQEKKIMDLTSLIERMKKERLIDQDGIDRLNSVAPANKEFLLRQLATVSDEVTAPNEYSTELKAFALTLHYYSPTAYAHVRDYFKLCLPHDKTIAKWYSKVNAAPGFTEESLNVLKQAAKNTPYTIVGALIMDEMGIRSHTEWDGSTFHGFVDIGSQTEEDNLPMAKMALVFMVVSVNCSWKIPVGYFFIDGLNAQQRASLVNQCLILLQETAIKVVSLTCDGLQTNLSTARVLGCDFNVDKMKTTFKHPVETENDVAFILDPCHMLKLVRNTFGEKKSAADENNNLILWSFITKLQETQTLEGLKMANSLSKHHTNFYAQKMKVKLASQLLSSSIADAIEHCNKDLEEEDFQDSEATVEFIRNFNELFDILNSRNLSQDYLKKPINERNETQIIQRLNEIYSYILNLKTGRNGSRIVDSPRKTGFLGFLICIKSMIHLYATLVQGETPLLKYLPMYKFSQDHLELFFSNIRSHCGHNHNPTARQFKSAYRKLLVKSEIKHSRASNCIALEDITILTAKSTDPVKVINSSTDKKILDDSSFIISIPPLYTDHDYMQCSGSLSEFASSVVEFMAGYVSRQLTESLKCIDCVSVLTSNVSVRRASLITRKNKGGLIYPSGDVFKICKRCEQIFRIAINQETDRKKLSVQVLSMSVLRSFQHENLFPELDRHMHDTSPLENHTIHLIRAIADKYFKIRLFSYGKSLVDTKNYLRDVSHKFEKLKNWKKWTGR